MKDTLYKFWVLNVRLRASRSDRRSAMISGFGGGGTLNGAGRGTVGQGRLGGNGMGGE